MTDRCETCPYLATTGCTFYVLGGNWHCARERARYSRGNDIHNNKTGGEEMTNFENVTRSAEELANFMRNFYNDSNCKYCAYRDKKECDEIPCVKGFVAWLNSKAEE